MHDFEKAFSDFLDHDDYEQVERAFFETMRFAFKAGWLAANDKEKKGSVELFRKKVSSDPFKKL